MVCLRGRRLRPPLPHGGGRLASNTHMENPTSNQRFARLIRTLGRWMLLGCLALLVAAASGVAYAQGDGTQAPWNKSSHSEKREAKQNQKTAQKQKEKAWKEFEENYKERQKRHYGFQKKHVQKRMRKGQQKARKHRDGRTVPWWRRIWLRKRWEKAPK